MFEEEENRNQCRIKYDKATDSYCLMLSTDYGETWDLSLASKCQFSKHDNEEDEPMYVHAHLIEELKKAVLCGFEMVY